MIGLQPSGFGMATTAVGETENPEDGPNSLDFSDEDNSMYLALMEDI